MLQSGRWLWLAIGVALGIGGATLLRTEQPRPVLAGNDRVEDYIITTGPITFGPNMTADCIWLLDYRAGKLLGTVVDKNFGKTVGWTELDLVKEFAIPPKQNVHFLMTTGSVINGQTALYLAEINSGKFAIYTMSPRLDPSGRMDIRRHDATLFRKPAE